MSINIELKKAITDAFKGGDFENAFTQLLTLPRHEVAHILRKKKWLKDESCAVYFWETFCIDKYKYTFDSHHSEVLLNWYFKNDCKTSDKLDAILSKHYPGPFLKAIKRNRAFLRDDYWQKVIANDWPYSYSIDLIACNQLCKRHAALQDSISAHWNKIKGLKIEFILSELICWIDKRFYSEDTPMNHEKLRRIYDYAVSFVFSQKKIEVAPSEDDFNAMFFNSMHTSRIYPFLESIAKWLEFETTILTSYCFDDNYKASMKEGIVHFYFESCEVHSKWEEDNERYMVSEKRYYIKALQIYNNQNKEGELEIPSGNSEMAKNINHTLYIKNWQSYLFLGDLHIRNFRFEKRSVHASKFVGGLMSYSVNRHWRYVECMRSFVNSGSPWDQSVEETVRKSDNEGVSNQPFPFMYLSKDELTKIYDDAIPELQKQEVEDLISHFSCTLNPIDSFDPFSLSYSVLEIPFIRIREHIFTSTSLFAINNWFYSFGQYGLKLYAKRGHTKERTETAAEMEVFLIDFFKEKGWNVNLISGKESSAIDGDIDVFVDDGSSQILIQLKRTTFKLDLASTYKDNLENDLKASGQLNEAVKSLNSNPTEDLEILEKHHKWIVTTSFEGVLSEIDGCLKVNYFDVIWALRNGKYDSLDELRLYIEADRPFKDCKHY